MVVSTKPLKVRLFGDLGSFLSCDGDADPIYPTTPKPRPNHHVVGFGFPGTRLLDSCRFGSATSILVESRWKRRRPSSIAVGLDIQRLILSLKSRVFHGFSIGPTKVQNCLQSLVSNQAIGSRLADSHGKRGLWGQKRNGYKCRFDFGS